MTQTDWLKATVFSVPRHFWSKETGARNYIKFTKPLTSVRQIESKQKNLKTREFFWKVENRFLTEGNLLFVITCSKKAIMEEVILRFPHLAKNIFEQVNFRSLANCSESSRLCWDFLNEEKILQKSMIKEYTKCSRGYLKVIY